MEFIGVLLDNKVLKLLRLTILVRARTCVAVHAKNKEIKINKKLSNRVPETTTTQAVPSLSRARTCVAIRAWPYVQKETKNFQTTTQAVPSLL